ncbi:ATP synthase subunit I [Clostridium sp. P21]|uniref:ATP synthase subunit I n=1 Tax=Clostridium muellerianum TaxID=2716538 RepID=A0A7Y0HNF3_9CLOT|nr:ATP synthase subunit I [Clostridium muellerianum]NMM61548.1 ATP synthase subunit I [Clostridium muellerianum]
MDKEIIDMIKKVSIINFILGSIIAIAIQMLMKNYGVFAFVGTIIAIINFNVNGIIGGLIFGKLKNSSTSLYILSFIFRVVLAVGIGYVIFKYNNYNVVPYLFGYTSHLVGVYIYSVIKNNQERM